MEAIQDLSAPSQTPPGNPQLHIESKLGASDQLRIAALEQGQTMRDLPPELWHDSYRRRANRRVADGTPTERRGGAPAGLRRLIADEPSKAITSAAAREFIHPLEDRPLTLRECARIQTFPDDFTFSGNRSEVAKLIGNAVPPAFAEAIGRAVRATLALPRRCAGKGRVISFDVTAAEAMSPALKAVVRLVGDRYNSKAELDEAGNPVQDRSQIQEML
jgi:DNA (cytosine-5)-methyltransferase 1